jgi:hypothetical protein
MVFDRQRISTLMLLWHHSATSALDEKFLSLAWENWLICYENGSIVDLRFCMYCWIMSMPHFSKTSGVLGYTHQFLATRFD